MCDAGINDVSPSNSFALAAAAAANSHRGPSDRGPLPNPPSLPVKVKLKALGLQATQRVLNAAAAGGNGTAALDALQVWLHVSACRPGLDVCRPDILLSSLNLCLPSQPLLCWSELANWHLQVQEAAQDFPRLVEQLSGLKYSKNLRLAGG